MTTMTRPTSAETSISLPSAPKASPPAPYSTPDDSSSAAETPCTAANLAAPYLVSTVRFTTVQNSDRELGPESLSPRAESKWQATEASTLVATAINGVTSRFLGIIGAEPGSRSEPPCHNVGVVAVVGSLTVSKVESREEEVVLGCDNLRRKQAPLVKPSSSLTPRSGAGMSGEARRHVTSNSAKLR